MKKVVRTIWIGLLSSLAFITACCSQNKINKNDEEKKQRVVQLQQQLDSINTIIRERESSCVYGSPEILEQYGAETRRLRQEAEDLRNQLNALKNE